MDFTYHGFHFFGTIDTTTKITTAVMTTTTGTAIKTSNPRVDGSVVIAFPVYVIPKPVESLVNTARPTRLLTFGKQASQESASGNFNRLQYKGQNGLASGSRRASQTARISISFGRIR